MRLVWAVFGLAPSLGTADRKQLRVFASLAGAGPADFSGLLRLVVSAAILSHSQSSSGGTSA